MMENYKNKLKELAEKSSQKITILANSARKVFTFEQWLYQAPTEECTNYRLEITKMLNTTGLIDQSEAGRQEFADWLVEFPEKCPYDEDLPYLTSSQLQYLADNGFRRAEHANTSSNWFWLTISVIVFLIFFCVIWCLVRSCCQNRYCENSYIIHGRFTRQNRERRQRENLERTIRNAIQLSNQRNEALPGYTEVVDGDAFGQDYKEPEGLPPSYADLEKAQGSK